MSIAVSMAKVAAVIPPSLDIDNYQVTYIPSAQTCKLASFEDAYAYTILAEDYMAQVNLVSTIGASDPDAYYQTEVAPRQSENMRVIAPSVGLELSGQEVKELFLTLSKRELAYHIWAMPRVCHLNDEDGGGMRVFLRETGLVQNTGEDVEGYGNVFTVFTTIELDFDEEGKVTQLVSVRDETLLGNSVFEGNAPREPTSQNVSTEDINGSFGGNSESGNPLQTNADVSSNASEDLKSRPDESGNDAGVDEEAEQSASSSASTFLHTTILATVTMTLF